MKPIVPYLRFLQTNVLRDLLRVSIATVGQEYEVYSLHRYELLVDLPYARIEYGWRLTEEIYAAEPRPWATIRVFDFYRHWLGDML